MTGSAAQAVALHEPVLDHRRDSGENATQGHTEPLWARLADLHAQLADCYRDLVERGEELPESGQIRVAVCAEQSDITSVERTPETRPLLSASALAKRLDVDPKTVRRWRLEGHLPRALKIGGVIRWRPEDIDAWIAGGAR